MAINRSSGTAQSGFRAIDANVSSGENSTPTRRASALSFDGGGAPAGAALRGSPGPSVIVLAPARGCLLPPGLLGVYGCLLGGGAGAAASFCASVSCAAKVSQL